MGSSPVQRQSIVTCPHCGHKEEEEMPEKACQFFWVCPECDDLIKPKQGDCCVFAHTEMSYVLQCKRRARVMCKSIESGCVDH